MVGLDFFRVGDKVIYKKKIERTITKILKMREKGLSQSKVAGEINVERSFISRLESIGEVRKGEKIALIGFPIANKQEITEIAKKNGVEFILLLTEEERWDFIKNKSSLEIFNLLMEILTRLKEFDLLIFLGSDMRLDLVDKLMDGKIVGIELGNSPLKENIYVDPDRIEEIIKNFSIDD
ncbi:transcriptional regulator [Halothermothrix orenii]|uniref:transcriptional regulator n=1 Tax=Halothermothrix orenii TaxID=31909 RepID=UPI0005A2CDAF|nr:transcriptional regulator [Halothermothrix orenii]